MNRQSAIIICLGVLLLSSVVAGFHLHHGDGERISELESQIVELREHEKQSAVDRRVSKQMEELAYGQQTLSEERSQEAISQSEIAQEMTLRSEKERQRAIKIMGLAEDAAEEAMAAYQMAEQQRVEAEEQRREAEHAKLVADTLNYISLARNLGSQSYSIYQAGETELGNMLAYASYLYTINYGGDLFIPAVFRALTQSAGGRRNWSAHGGSITCTEISPKDGHLLTVSTYGEIFTHRMQDDSALTIDHSALTIDHSALHTTRVMSDNYYCFRDGFAAKNGKDYAISHTGHLVVVDGKTVNRVIFLEGVDRPFSLESMNDGNQLLIVGENSIALLDIATDRIIGTRHLNFRVASTGRRDKKPLLFDNRGGMHLVSDLDNMTDDRVPVAGQVTAFASSKNTGFSAYGMADGTIWLIDGKGKTYRLVEHLSQVTKMSFNGYRLYSSSYDGKMLFWMTGDSQIKPITLFQCSSWITSFTFSTDKDYIWTGEYNGTITEYLISLPQIAQRLRENIKRDFTQDEWNYYVGKGIPYAAFGLNNNE